PTVTKGLGAGAVPEVARKAAEESEKDIKELVKGADLVFITAGMGGGTGSGAAPLVARAAKETGALVVAIVTTPFNFEGASRTRTATEALEELKKEVDSIIVVSNDRLAAELGGVAFSKAFEYADTILKLAVVTIVDIISTNSSINLDFADVKKVLKGEGLALNGTADAEGESASIDAALKANNSPILESSMEGAKKAIVMVMGSERSLTIDKAYESVQTIKEAANSDLDVIFGVRNEEALGDKVLVSVIATGFEKALDIGVQSSYLINSTQNLCSLTQEVNLDAFKSIEENDELPPIKQSTDTQERVFESLSLLDDDDDDDDISSLLR
ncbi:cell division protein FtsZ, partial [Mycobacterium sp.]|uniref:cell division protein FtsZ n=1 Tax=Mycobacterium sp. TaxID=1785 RepID=UPI003A8ACF97